MNLIRYPKSLKNTLIGAALAVGITAPFVASAATYQFRVSAAGVISPPSFTAVTDTLSVQSFASTPLGQTSAQRGAISFKNTGGRVGTLEVPSFSGSAARDFSVLNPEACASVALGGTCTYSITFTPSTVGVLGATLAFSEGTFSFNGVGQGSPAFALVTAKASNLTFNSSSVNVTSSSSQVWTFQNTGSAAGSLAAPVISGGTAQDFAATSNCQNVGIGQSCSVVASFTPKAVGERSTNVTINAMTYALSGYGGLGSFAHANGYSMVGCSRGYLCSISISIKNVGAAPARIASYRFLDGAAWGWTLQAPGVVANDCRSVDVAPNATCVIPLQFKSNTVGQTMAIMEGVTTDSVTNSLTLPGGYTAMSSQ